MNWWLIKDSFTDFLMTPLSDFISQWFYLPPSGFTVCKSKPLCARLIWSFNLNPPGRGFDLFFLILWDWNSCTETHCATLLHCFCRPDCSSVGFSSFRCRLVMLTGSQEYVACVNRRCDECVQRRRYYYLIIRVLAAQWAHWVSVRGMWGRQRRVAKSNSWQDFRVYTVTNVKHKTKYAVSELNC